MTEKTFSKKIQDIMGENAPKELTGGFWRGKSYSHIYLDKKYNFIDGKYPEKCDLKGDYFGEDKIIKYHGGASHLNSSQVVCINFFKKFFEKQKWEHLLLEVLVRNGVSISATITGAVFEYEPDPKERTNFDFYMVMSDDTHISIEVKYTESEFGGISPDKNDPDKYSRKWTEIYRKMVDACPYLNCDEEDFYNNYQINRNISFAGIGDVVLFLTPRANNAQRLAEGRQYIDSCYKQYHNIMNIYWEDIMEELMKLIKNEPDLLDYYGKFKKKYIDILLI